MAYVASQASPDLNAEDAVAKYKLDGDHRLSIEEMHKVMQALRQHARRVEGDLRERARRVRVEGLLLVVSLVDSDAEPTEFFDLVDPIVGPLPLSQTQTDTVLRDGL